MVHDAYKEDREEQLLALINTLPDFVTFKDGEGKWIQANPITLKLFGLEHVEYQGKTDEELAEFADFSRDALLHCIETDEQAWQSRKMVHIEKVVPQLNGTSKFFDTIKVPVFHPDGCRKALVVIGRDITERKQATDDLNSSREQFRTIFENAGIGMALIDKDGRYIESNPALEAILQFSNEELQKMTVWRCTHPDDVAPTNRLFEEMIAGKRDTYRIEKRLVRKDGHTVWGNITVTQVRGGDGQIQFMIGMVEDITDRKRTEHIINHMAYHDSLTGLPNRRGFNEYLSVILKDTHHPLCIMFLDLDRFKVLNDSMGHDCGDLLLQLVANRLEQCLDYTGNVYRIGGDEFVIVIKDVTTVDMGAAVAQSILDSLTMEPFVVEDNELFVSASVGLTFYPKDGTDKTTLTSNADIAMYRAKQLGGNQYEFYSSSLSVSKNMTIENHLRRAQAREEFFLCYQPRVETRTHQIVGFEALIRWNSPELGVVPPLDFIPVAEENGLIVSIGKWVLRTACAQNKAWQDAGLLHVPVSVNISARQFQNNNVVQTVKQVLDETGLEGRYLELEITESLLVHNNKETIDTLNALKDMGVRISIDDFGTGYSSLSYLKKFPIDSLKIDQSFIRDLDLDESAPEILSAMITLGHSLKLNVVAEGVETGEHREFLLNRRCNEMQGYFISKPIPAPEMEHMIKTHVMG